MNLRQSTTGAFIMVLLLSCGQKADDQALKEHEQPVQTTSTAERDYEIDETAIGEEEFSSDPSRAGYSGIPDVTVPTKTFATGPDIYSYGFSVPDDVKNEEIAFNPLTELPSLGYETDKEYIMVTRDAVKIYSQPDKGSAVVKEAMAGDIFIYLNNQDLPAEYDDLPEEERLKIEDYWGFLDDLKEEYKNYPGILVDGYYNYWIKVKDAAVTGWIFRAYTFSAHYHDLMILYELYKRGSAFRSYQDYFISEAAGDWEFNPFDQTDRFDDLKRFGLRILQKESLTDVQKKKIQADYMDFQKVSPSEYTLSMDKPDDMLSLYLDEMENRLNPIFITTDLVIHCLHLIFDRALQDIEEKQMLPFVRHLSRTMYDAVVQVMEMNDQPVLEESCRTLLCFFGVALSLLGDLDEADQVILEETEAVCMKGELDNILEVKDYAQSPLFGFEEDYSQFIPRGHYTKSEELTIYFRVMMWYSFMKFFLEDGKTNTGEIISGQEPTRMALIITLIMKNDPALFHDYFFYEEAMGYLVGKSNDANPVVYMEILEFMNTDYGISHLAHDEYVTAFRKEAVKKLPEPEIRGSKVLVNPGESPDSQDIYRAPRIFHLFSQKVTLDAKIFTLLSNPDTRLRFRVKPFDIAASFGSDFADKQCAADKQQYTDYMENLSRSREMVDSIGPLDWHTTYYQSYLSSIRTFLQFPGNTGIPWFDSEKYMQKNHLTFFGAYTELKYDTLLYAMQSYGAAEMGGGVLSYAYSTKSLPDACCYIEPNLAFFKNLLTMYNTMVKSPGGRLLFSSNMGNGLESFFKIVKEMHDIVEKEVRFEKINSYEFMFELPQKLIYTVLPDDFYPGMDADDGGNDFKMAVVADIYTNAQDREVLHCGTGLPVMMYIPVYDHSGGRRICRGYTYSYYEFWTPVSKRMNTEEWKKLVYSESLELFEKVPAWVRDLMD